MKGAHSAKKAVKPKRPDKPKKAEKSKKKKSGSPGVALRVDPDIIKSTLAAKPAQDEKEQSSRKVDKGKSGKSAHGVEKKSRRAARDDDANKGSKALVCIAIAVIALACLVVALATHAIDLSMDPDKSASPAEQHEETNEPEDEEPASAAVRQEAAGSATSLDNLIEGGSYHNARFGFIVQVPDGFHVDSLIDGGDGIILANDALDMIVRVTGSNNLDGRSAQDILDAIWNQGDDSIGRAEGNRVIVYQYDEMSEYFYWIYVGSGSIDQMVIEYPVQDDNDAELAMARKLMDGFTPGRINRQH